MALTSPFLDPPLLLNTPYLPPQRKVLMLLERIFYIRLSLRIYSSTYWTSHFSPPAMLIFQGYSLPPPSRVNPIVLSSSYSDGPFLASSSLSTLNLSVEPDLNPLSLSFDDLEDEVPNHSDGMGSASMLCSVPSAHASSAYLLIMNSPSHLNLPIFTYRPYYYLRIAIIITHSTPLHLYILIGR